MTAHNPSPPASPFPYAGPEGLREAVVQALSRVVDPEVALSIVDLGLVYGVKIEGQAIHVRMTMTSAACPVTDMIVEDLKTELQRVLPDASTEVELCWQPPWSPERMSERAKRLMT